MSNFVLGFIAGEGSFQLTARQNPRDEEKTAVRPKFSVLLTDNDSTVLKSIQKELGGVGQVTETGDGHVQLQVSAKKELVEVKDYIHQNESELWNDSCKSSEFDRWKRVVEIYSGGRTTPEQKLKMLQIATEMNSGGRKRETPIEEHIERVEKRIKTE